MDDKEVIIVGGFHEIIELCENLGKKIIGIIDNLLQNSYLGYPILGKDVDADALFSIYKNVPLIITPDNPHVREKLYRYYSEKGFRFTSLISNRAIVSKSARIGVGAIIQDGVNLSAFAEIGDFVKLNSCSNLMHDVVVESFSTIAPGAVVLGRVQIGTKSYIGANATILPNLTIADGTTVGAGAVVAKNTESNSTVVGVPAKKI
ncbi:MAG: hypothetical protein GX361_10080 [Bacteroidales bacterium]|nr:hypothetical protein [Bacteroidales bacterium]